MNSKIPKPSHSRFRDFIKDISFDVFNTARYLRHNVQLGLTRQNFLTGKSEHPPVILIQGFLGTSRVLDPLERFFQQKGREVYMIDLGVVNIKDIQESSERLLFEIERLMDLYSEKYSFSSVDIVAHSMGGLIAFYYIKKLGGHRCVGKLITLGTPFRGTWAALLGSAIFGLFSKGVRQMLPNSSFLKELHTPHQSESQTKVYSVAAQYDTISTPESCFLKGAVNRVLPLGHAGLLMDRRVFESILQFLDDKEEKSKVVQFEHFRV